MRSRHQQLGDIGCALVESCVVINAQRFYVVDVYRSGFDLKSKVDGMYVVEVKTKTTYHPVVFSASQSRCIKSSGLEGYYFVAIVKRTRNGCKMLAFSRSVVLKHTKDAYFDWWKVRRMALLRCKVDSKGAIGVRHGRGQTPSGCNLRLRSSVRHQTAARRRLLSALIAV
jgi:hypothetical protein